MPPRRRRPCRRTGGPPRRPGPRPRRPPTCGAYRSRVVRRYHRRTGGKFKNTMKKIGLTALEVLKTVPRAIGINV